ncbi:MAG: hypothetical protein R3F36_14365 [Candidatus Competibacteraceae bacterium]
MTESGVGFTIGTSVSEGAGLNTRGGITAGMISEAARADAGWPKWRFRVLK